MRRKVRFIWDFLEDGYLGAFSIASQGISIKIQWSNSNGVNGYMIGESIMKEAE